MRDAPGRGASQSGRARAASTSQSGRVRSGRVPPPGVGSGRVGWGGIGSGRVGPDAGSSGCRRERARGGAGGRPVPESGVRAAERIRDSSALAINGGVGAAAMARVRAVAPWRSIALSQARCCAGEMASRHHLAPCPHPFGGRRYPAPPRRSGAPGRSRRALLGERAEYRALLRRGRRGRQLRRLGEELGAQRVWTRTRRRGAVGVEESSGDRPARVSASRKSQIPYASRRVAASINRSRRLSGSPPGPSGQ